MSGPVARTAARGLARAARRPTTWPWWAQVVAVVLLARLLSALVLLAVARTQMAAAWVGDSPSYFSYTGLMWDASWYREIAEQGYPTVLPRGADGAVLQNVWAFFPLFPLLVRGVMALTGGTWTVVAPLLATVLGVAAMLVVHQVVAHAMAQPRALPLDRGRPGARAAVPLLTVALLATSASSPVLQVGYTESLALLLVASVLGALQRRRYGLAAVLVLLLGLTRAVALPVTVAVAAHALVRRRSLDARDRLALLAVGILSVVAGLAWPAVAGAVTGVPGAYALTQAAWRGRAEVVPFLPWLDVTRWLLGDRGPTALIVLLVLAVLAAAALTSRPMRRLGPELAGWTAGYVGYLAAVIEPGTSLVRFSLLAVPFWAALAQPVAVARHRIAAASVLVALGVLGQIAWVGLLWRLVPPSGWPP